MQPSLPGRYIDATSAYPAARVGLLKKTICSSAAGYHGDQALDTAFCSPACSTHTAPAGASRRACQHADEVARSSSAIFCLTKRTSTVPQTALIVFASASARRSTAPVTTHNLTFSVQGQMQSPPCEFNLSTRGLVASPGDRRRSGGGDQLQTVALLLVQQVFERIEPYQYTADAGLLHRLCTVRFACTPGAGVPICNC